MAILVTYLVVVNTNVVVCFGVGGMISGIRSRGMMVICITSSTSRSRAARVNASLGNVDGIRDYRFIPGRITFRRRVRDVNNSTTLFRNFSRVPLPSTCGIAMGSLSRFRAAISRVGRVGGISSIQRGDSLTDGLLSLHRTISVIDIKLIMVLFLITLFVVSGAVHVAVFSEGLRVSVVGTMNTAG